MLFIKIAETVPLIWGQNPVEMGEVMGVGGGGRVRSRISQVKAIKPGSYKRKGWV